jgi:hypothetical protein
MFDNLSQREKVLATLVVSLIPLALLVMGLFWFFGQRSARNAQLAGLRSQIKIEQQRLTDALNANQRRIYYRGVSLPSNFEDARNEYQQWLKNLVRNEVGMSYRSITPRSPARLKFNGNVIGQTETFTLLATTNLKQLVDFLTQFYQVDLLHRINSIKLVPKSAGKSGVNAGIRTGEIALSAEIEVLSLIDADAERDFITQFRELEVAAEDYRDAILKRNIFGPANNTPTLTVSKSSSYVTGKSIRIPISGKDPDSDQILTFTVVDSQIQSTVLEQKKPTDRRVFLTAPGQKAGEYKFKVRVADDGFPAKSSEKEFTVRFKDKVVRKPPPPKPPKPPKPVFKHARETRITAIVQDKSGTWRVWITVRTKGEKHKLAEGESFKLDGQTWSVISISPDEARFMVDGNEKTFRRNMTFDGTEKAALLAP